MFDSPAYVRSLAWLGAARVHGDVAWLERPVLQGGWDARGSWPSGSIPDQAMLRALVAQGADRSEATRLLSWTGVVRPDFCLTGGLSAALRTLREQG
jgi:hypothetical protein